MGFGCWIFTVFWLIFWVQGFSDIYWADKTVEYLYDGLFGLVPIEDQKYYVFSSFLKLKMSVSV